MTALQQMRIDKAKMVLSDMYKVDLFYLENNKNRKANIVEARRFLIHYMYNEIGITFNGMKNHIKGLHHATAIYHNNKIKELMEFEPKLRQNYQDFMIESNELKTLNIMLQAKRNVAKNIMKEIKEINNQIKEKKYDN